MTTLVNTASGQVLGVVDGRNSAAVEHWLNARSQKPTRPGPTAP